MKTSKLVFATLTLTSFGLRPNYGGLNMKTVQARHRIQTLTSFAQARNWRLSYEMYASIHFAAFGLTVSQHLSKCYQHIFYEF